MTADSATPGASKQIYPRVRNVVLWVLQVLVAAMFVLTGYIKLSGDPAAVAAFDVIGAGQWFLYLIGSLELVGALALIIPQLAGLAGLAFAGLMVGAIITDVFVLAHPPVASAVLLVLAVIIAVGRWESTVRLFSAVLRR